MRWIGYQTIFGPLNHFIYFETYGSWRLNVSALILQYFPHFELIRPKVLIRRVYVLLHYISPSEMDQN